MKPYNILCKSPSQFAATITTKQHYTTLVYWKLFLAVSQITKRICPLVFIFHQFWKRSFQDKHVVFLKSWKPFSKPDSSNLLQTNSVKALMTTRKLVIHLIDKEILMLSLFTIWLLTEGTMILSCWLSNAGSLTALNKAVVHCILCCRHHSHEGLV